MMALVKQKEGNRMYPWVTHCWNPIGGCEHRCSYCYMHRLSKRLNKDMLQVKFRASYLKDNLGDGRTIFVGSSGDMWGDWVPSGWIVAVLRHCRAYPDNAYHFQSKNPARFQEFQFVFPKQISLGTTIESDLTNLLKGVSAAPWVWQRMDDMQGAQALVQNASIMVSVEPVVRFSASFAEILLSLEPDFISIGADTGNNGLPEPSADELRELIYALQEHTEVKLKPNLSRLIDLSEFQAPAVEE